MQAGQRRRVGPCWLLLAGLGLTSLACATGGSSARAMPLWVEGTDPAFDSSRLLTAVGYGADRTAAENGALANLSRIFEASIASVSQDYMAAFSSGGQALEVQSVETLTQVSTEKVLAGVQIVDVWDNPATTRTGSTDATTTAGARVYALAALERGPAAATARTRIEELDGEVGSYIEAAKGASDSVQRLTNLRKAAKAMQERMAQNAELRIIERSGEGVPATHAPADIAALVDTAKAALNVGVQVEGAAAGDLSAGLIEGLTKAGLEVAEIEAGADTTAFDLVVRAKCRLEDASGAGKFKMARVVISVELANIATGRVIGSFTESRKEGGDTGEAAASRAVRKLQNLLVNKIQAVIEEQFGGSK